MDIFNLNEKVKGLVSYLQDTGYSAMYIFILLSYSSILN